MIFPFPVNSPRDFPETQHLIVQKRKLRPRKGNQLAQGLTATSPKLQDRSFPYINRNVYLTTPGAINLKNIRGSPQ